MNDRFIGTAVTGFREMPSILPVRLSTSGGYNFESGTDALAVGWISSRLDNDPVPRWPVVSV